MDSRDNIFGIFSDVEINPSWAFSDKTIKQTAYASHGYHRYPAKFIPQIVERLAKKYSCEGDKIADPFGGCGTTLVESKILRRSSLGTDINPVAVMMTKAKITPIAPFKLYESLIKLEEKIRRFDESQKINAPQHERIDYWFGEDEKNKLAFIDAHIANVDEQDIKQFFYCGFSNILKNCSIWNQKSNKPTRDFNKKPEDPFTAFSRQMKKMMRGNVDYFDILKKNKSLETQCDIHCADARVIPAKSNTVDLIITSPPYVTSYEYADLHQLTALWFDYANDISHFRKAFIGTSHHDKKKISMNSVIAEEIVKQLRMHHNKTAIEVATYFSEMFQVFQKMFEILRKNGKICVVIGNTTLKGQKISNAEVFTEQLLGLGFEIEDIIQREIPSKNLPSTRDKNTGRFVKATSADKVLVYPTEYIVIMRKK